MTERPPGRGAQRRGSRRLAGAKKPARLLLRSSGSDASSRSDGIAAGEAGGRGGEGAAETGRGSCARTSDGGGAHFVDFAAFEARVAGTARLLLDPRHLARGWVLARVGQSRERRLTLLRAHAHAWALHTRGRGGQLEANAARERLLET